MRRWALHGASLALLRPVGPFDRRCALEVPLLDGEIRG
jgi:hypothetical protein